MKNKLVQNITGLSVIAMSLNMAIADEITQNQPIAGSNVLPVKVVLIKFLITMGLVGVALAILWFVLVFYKKFSNKSWGTSAKHKSKFYTPTTVEDAAISFIMRNKL